MEFTTFTDSPPVAEGKIRSESGEELSWELAQGTVRKGFSRAFRWYPALPLRSPYESAMAGLVLTDGRPKSEWKYLASESESEHGFFCIVISFKNNLYEIPTMTRSDIVLRPEVVLRLKKDRPVEGQGLVVGSAQGVRSNRLDGGFLWVSCAHFTN